jgi:hypothetical protein
MQIGDRVKTTPAYAKEFAKEFAGVINTQPEKIRKNGLDKNHPTKTYTVATVKTDAGDIRYIGISWLMSV